MSELVLRVEGDKVSFEVRVAPRASRSAVTGVHDGALKVSLNAPPVDGAANGELIELLSDELGVPKRAIEILRGERSKSKSVRVTGTTAAAVHALVAPALR